MKKAKLKTTNKKKTEEIESKFSTGAKVITVLLMLALLLGAYLLAGKIISNNKTEEEPEVIDVRSVNSINYSDVEDLKGDSYYLLFDKEDDEYNSTYDVYINSLKYSGYNEEFYYIDLSSDKNKDILGDKESLKDLKKIKVKDTTLVYVKDGKIEETYVGSGDISSHLLSFFNISVGESESDDESNSNSNTKSNSNSNTKSNSNSNTKSNSNSNTKSNSKSNDKSDSKK